MLGLCAPAEECFQACLIGYNLEFMVTTEPSVQRCARRRQAEEHVRQLAFKRRLAAAVTTEAPGANPTTTAAPEPQGRRLSRRGLSLTSGQAAAAAEAAVAAAYDMARTAACLAIFCCAQMPVVVSFAVHGQGHMHNPGVACAFTSGYPLTCIYK